MSHSSPNVTLRRPAAPADAGVTGVACRRVAHVVESYAMGGVERHVALLIRHGRRDRYEPVLLCPPEPDILPLIQEVRDMGFRALEIPQITTRKSPSITAVLTLASELKALKLDILHLHILGGGGGRYIVLAARIARIPHVVVTVHGAALIDHGALSKRSNRAMNRLVSAVTVASAHNRMLQTAHMGLPSEDVHVIRNAIDLEQFNPRDDQISARRALALPQDCAIVGAIARLEHQKGLIHFVEMARLLLQSMPGTRFVIVGDGEQRREIDLAIRDRGLDDRILLLGYRSDVAVCLAAMDVFVLPSMFEPFGLALVEAMAMRKPIVASRVGGIPEVVCDGETGTLVPPGDPAAIASAVLAYLDNPDLAQRHAAEGQRRAERLFTVDRLVRETEALYDNLRP